MVVGAFFLRPPADPQTLRRRREVSHRKPSVPIFSRACTMGQASVNLHLHPPGQQSFLLTGGISVRLSV